MNDHEAAVVSADWWSRPWWKRPGGEVYCPFTEEELSRATGVLRRYFDSEWTRDMSVRPRRNVVFGHLCIGGSTGALEFIVYLGELLGTLESSDGIARVITALKGEKSHSALLEIEAAYAFAAAGYKVRFPSEGDARSPDVLAELGDRNFAIECKRLEPELWEDWEEQLMMDLMQILARSDRAQQLSISIFLNPRLSQICMGGDTGPYLNAAFRDAIVRSVVNVVTDAIEQRKFPIDVPISDLALVRIAHRTPNDLGQISGMERASPALTRRIVQNGIMRACKQLPAHMPGVVFVYSKTLPNPQFFRTFFEALCKVGGSGVSQLAAVVLCPLQTILCRSSPLIFANASTQFGSEVPAILDVLRSKFGGQLISKSD